MFDRQRQTHDFIHGVWHGGLIFDDFWNAPSAGIGHPERDHLKRRLGIGLRLRVLDRRLRRFTFAQPVADQRIDCRRQFLAASQRSQKLSNRRKARLSFLAKRPHHRRVEVPTDIGTQHTQRLGPTPHHLQYRRCRRICFERSTAGQQR